MHHNNESLMVIQELLNNDQSDKYSTFDKKYMVDSLYSNAMAERKTLRNQLKRYYDVAVENRKNRAMGRALIPMEEDGKKIMANLESVEHQLDIYRHLQEGSNGNTLFEQRLERCEKDSVMDKRSNGTQFIADKVENRFGRLFDEYLENSNEHLKVKHNDDNGIRASTFSGRNNANAYTSPLKNANAFTSSRKNENVYASPRKNNANAFTSSRKNENVYASPRKTNAHAFTSSRKNDSVYASPRKNDANAFTSSRKNNASPRMNEWNNGHAMQKRLGNQETFSPRRSIHLSDEDRNEFSMQQRQRKLTDVLLREEKEFEHEVGEMQKLQDIQTNNACEQLVKNLQGEYQKKKGQFKEQLLHDHENTMKNIHVYVDRKISMERNTMYAEILRKQEEQINTQYQILKGKLQHQEEAEMRKVAEALHTGGKKRLQALTMKLENQLEKKIRDMKESHEIKLDQAIKRVETNAREADREEIKMVMDEHKVRLDTERKEIQDNAENTTRNAVNSLLTKLQREKQIEMQELTAKLTAERNEKIDQLNNLYQMELNSSLTSLRTNIEQDLQQKLVELRVEHQSEAKRTLQRKREEFESDMHVVLRKHQSFLTENDSEGFTSSMNSKRSGASMPTSYNDVSKMLQQKHFRNLEGPVRQLLQKFRSLLDQNNTLSDKLGKIAQDAIALKREKGEQAFIAKEAKANCDDAIQKWKKSEANATRLFNANKKLMQAISKQSLDQKESICNV